MLTGNNTLDLRESGLGMFLSPYQIDALEYLYTVKEATSKHVWTHINRVDAPDPKSRASVINYLQVMAEEGLITVVQESSKGGHRGVYSVSASYPSLEQLERELVRRLLVKVAEEFNVFLGYLWDGEHAMEYIDVGEDS